MSKEIPLDKAIADSHQDGIWALRGHSIQAYANVEQSLCRLFQILSETTMENAEIVFHRINNSRNMILDKLMKKKFKDEYAIIFNTFMKEIRNITETRHCIVHWNARVNVGDNGYESTILAPPYIWAYDPSMPFITNHDLEEFIKKCGFMSRCCHMFSFFISEHSTKMRLAQAWRDTWRDIFQQALVYPPPHTHPLNPNAPKP